jgi:cysteine-rich repeat protein
VEVSELVVGLGIAQQRMPVEECEACDADHSGFVTIDELVAAVYALLTRCSTRPLPTPTPTSTPTSPPTETSTPTETPTAGPPACGNGRTEDQEECDDRNDVDGDGCNGDCVLEPGGDVCTGIPTASGSRLAAVLVADRLSQPLYVTAPPCDPSRIFIVEQPGRIRIVKWGELLNVPFLDLRDKVNSGGERGLLSLAFHPDYAENGEFFVDYTTGPNEELVSIVSRFRVSDDPDRADPLSEEIILQQNQPFVAHNGGQLFFGPDRYFYVSFGDGGQASGNQNNAQDGTTWLGKVLRIDVDGGKPYAIPPDNPFAGDDGVLDEIWLLGLRNPWRVSIDPVTEAVYIGDVGEQRYEEVNVQPRDQLGLNYGWCCREGNEPYGGRCFESAETCAGGVFTSPTLVYEHASEGPCSVTGGFVYRGCAMPDLHGTYFYGDFCTAFVRSFVYEDGEARMQRDWTEELAPGGGRTIDSIAGFGTDARGELYICDLRGEVYKIVAGSE